MVSKKIKTSFLSCGDHKCLLDSVNLLGNFFLSTRLVESSGHLIVTAISVSFKAVVWFLSSEASAAPYTVDK